MSKITVSQGDPKSPDGTALLTASQTYLSERYAPEDNYFLSIDALCAPGIRFFIARAEGAAVGCVALAAKPGYGEVKSLYVQDDARGSGVGAALLHALTEAARADGMTLLRLETGDDLAPAHRLYAAHGFTICGPFGDYREGPHSVFMEKPL